MNVPTAFERREQLKFIDGLCDRFEERWRNGPRPNINAFLGELPEDLRVEAIADLLEIDVSCRRALGELPQKSDYQFLLGSCADIVGDVLTRADNESAEKSAIEELPKIPGLKIIRKLGQGGMGVVYLAEQLELRRLVAVKMLRSGAAAEASERARFRTEIEAAASLNHPGIVHVYQVGHVEGKPYCILEYVEGGTLRDYLCRRPQDPNRAAEFIRNLALALSHAHQLGFIHRDLKPANILLEYGGQSNTSFSETMRQQADHTAISPGEKSGDSLKTSDPEHFQVVRSATKSDIHDAPLATPQFEAFDEAPLICRTKPSSPLAHPKITDFGLARRLESIETANTQSGVILGTLNYLSPEQAKGQSRNVGPTTDIYSLGAILFEMLTGRTPHDGVDPFETLQRIRNCDVVSPRLIRPEIPRDLETICLKCLSHDPTKRYQSALNLSDDLGQFLAHEPIKARPIGSLERLWRWCRRERRVAVLAFAIFMVTTVSIVACTYLWKNNQLLTSGQFKQQLTKVEQDLEFINRQEFSFVPKMDETRRQFLEQLSKQCLSLLDLQADDPILRRQFARVRHQLGLIYGLLGAHSQAAKEITTAIEIQTEIVESDYAAPGDRKRRAQSRHELGNILRKVGRFDEAQSQLELAVDDYELEQKNLDVSLDLGNTLCSLGAIQTQTGQLDEGQKNLRQAIEYHRSAAEQSDLADIHLALSRTETELALFLLNCSQMAEAESLLNDAIARQEKLLGAENSPGVRQGLSQSLAARARALDLNGRGTERDEDAVKAYLTIKPLADEFPHRPDYRIEACLMLQNAARYNATLPGDIRPELSPVSGVYWHPLEGRLREAMRLQEELAEDFPDFVENWRRLARTKNELATYLVDTSSYHKNKETSEAALAEGESVHRECEGILERLVGDFPKIISFQIDLARCDQRYGIALFTLGRLDEAERHYLRAVESQSKLAELYPEMSAHRTLLCALQNCLGVIADRCDDMAKAEDCFRKASAHGQFVLGKTPRHETAQILMAVTRGNIVEILFRTGRYREAVADLEPVQDIWTREVWQSERLFDLCGQFANALNQDVNLAGVERTKILTELEDRTIRMVQKSLKLSSSDTNIQKLKTSPWFEHVRHREEFQALLR